MQRYRERISGALLDRIDIHLKTGDVTYQKMTDNELGESSESAPAAGGASESDPEWRASCAAIPECPRSKIKVHCQLGEAGAGMMQMAMTELILSAGAYDRILNVSRTIADLAGSEQVQAEHVADAIQYRTLDRSLWS